MDTPLTPALTLFAILLTMVAEARRSFRNELALRGQGAVEPAGDVYALMQVAYPACFVAMAVEGTLRGAATPGWFVAGAALFLGAKLLKYWTISALGARWCFRVLVPPGGARVETGPYRWLRHPNYVAVFGEMAAAMVMMAAFFTGAISLLGFGLLIAMRIRVEEAALAAPTVRPRASR